MSGRDDVLGLINDSCSGNCCPESDGCSWAERRNRALSWLKQAEAVIAAAGVMQRESGGRADGDAWLVLTEAFREFDAVAGSGEGTG